MRSALASLTERERRLLALVADGLTDRAVARQLGYSHGGVRSQLQALYARTGIRGRTALVAAWLRSEAA